MTRAGMSGRPTRVVRRRRVQLRVLAVAWLALGVWSSARAQTVTVNGATQYQVIEGGGTDASLNWTGAYPIPLRDVAAQTYALGFRYMRSFLNLPEAQNDDSDPFNYNWASFNQQFAAADATLATWKVWQDAGFTFAYNPQWAPRWMLKQSGSVWSFDSSLPGIYDELAESWVAFLLYAQNQHGLVIPYIDVHHEPECNTSSEFTPAQLTEAIKRIGARLVAAGLPTRITSPHGATTASAQSYLQTILADPVAAGYLDAVAYHPYDYDATNPGVMRNFVNDTRIKASALPIWDTEWTLQRTAAYPKRSEAYNGTGDLAYSLEYGKWLHDSYVEGNVSTGWTSPGIAVECTPDVGMFGPGFWGGGLRVKKFGHVLSQFHRFIEPGSRRVDITSAGVANVFLSAYLHPRSGALAVVMLNKTAGTVSLTINLTDLTAPASMRCVRTKGDEDSAELGRTAVTGNAFNVTLPAASITTCVGSTSADSVAPSVPVGVGATALSDTLARVSWSASTDAVAVAGYHLFRDGVAIGQTAGTSYVDSGLSGGTSYSYAVSAFDLAGNESGRSAAASLTPPTDTTPTAVPAHVVATPQPGAIAVTWDPSTDSVADYDLAGFRVYRATVSGGPYALVASLGDPTATGYTDTTASNGQAAYYAVTAVDHASPVNESARSREASATPYNRVAGGLAADYYDSATQNSAWEWFATLRAFRIDPQVDFNWEQVTPPAGRYIKGLYGTTYHWSVFGARWQGEVLADHAETYTFETVSLDGARLWVDGKLVIDEWAGWFTRTRTAQVALTPGWHALRLDYYRYHPEAGEDGVIRLSYSSPSVAKAVIPATHLATVSATAPGPDGGLQADAAPASDAAPTTDAATGADADAATDAVAAADTAPASDAAAAADAAVRPDAGAGADATSGPDGGVGAGDDGTGRTLVSGCACRTSGAGAGSPLLVLLVVALMVLNRSRPRPRSAPSAGPRGSRGYGDTYRRLSRTVAT